MPEEPLKTIEEEPTDQPEEQIEAAEQLVNEVKEESNDPVDEKEPESKTARLAEKKKPVPNAQKLYELTIV